VREAVFGADFGLAMMIFGELNGFPRETAAKILTRVHSALAEDGFLLLEPYTFATIENMGKSGSHWHTAEGSLFCDTPHLCLIENFWDSSAAVATTRYFTIELATGVMTRNAQSYQGYSEANYRDLLRQCGFEAIEFFPSLTGVPEKSKRELCVILARKESGVV